MDPSSINKNLLLQVCHGSGKTAEESQNDAASRALLLIADTGLENGNCLGNIGATTEDTVTTKLPNSTSAGASETLPNL